MIRWEKMMCLGVFLAVLVIMASEVQAVQGQVSNKQASQAVMKIPVKISFNISPNASYFWSAGLTEDGNLSWAGLPAMITIRVGIGGPVYKIIPGTSMPFVIDTGDVKFVAGSQVVLAVQIDSKNGYRVANKLYAVPVSNAVFNITLMGPTQPLLYKPVFNP
jgi:hypothetical protein